jgi:hypothetical protein
MNLREIEWEGLDWIQLSQNTFGIHKRREFPDQLSDYQILKKDSASYSA